MGKSLSAITKLVNLYKQQEQYQFKHIKQVKPISVIQRVGGGGGAEEKSKKKQKRMESGSGVGNSNSNSNSNNININTMDSTSNTRVPLSEVVSDCVKRWFKDTLKEAKAGDINMQVLVSQMYYSGYGIPRDAQKGRIWMSRASRIRSSVWKVSDKHPGYNASDSDSDELKGES